MGLNRIGQAEKDLIDERKRLKKEDAIRIMDAIIPFLPLEPFNISRFITKNEAQLNTQDVSRASQIWDEIETQLTANGYGSHRNGTVQFELSGQGKQAKQCGGHYNFLNRAMRTEDYMFEILKVLKDGNFRHVKDIFLQLHYDTDLSSGIKSKLIEKDFVGSTKEGEYIKQKGEGFIVQYKLGEHKQPVAPVTINQSIKDSYNNNHTGSTVVQDSTLSAGAGIQITSPSTPQSVKDDKEEKEKLGTMRKIWEYISNNKLIVAIIMVGLTALITWLVTHFKYVP